MNYLKNLRENNFWNIYFILTLAFLIRFILAFFLISFIDLPNYTEVGNYLNYGLNPYDLSNNTYPINFYRKYPPLFFELLAVWFRIFGNSAFSFKMLILTFDMATTWLLYIIGMHIKNEIIGTLYAFFYAFFPFNVIAFTYGENDAIPVFFTTAALYFYLKKRYGWMNFFIALGISFKIYPIFILWAFLLYFFKKKMFNELLKALLINIAVFVVLSLPFLILSPMDFFQSLSVHFSRINTGISFFPLVFPLYEHSFTINLWRISISLSLNMIIELSVYTLLSLYFIISPINKEPGKIKNSTPLIWSVIFLGLQPIFQHKGNMSLFCWLSPMAIILIFYSQETIPMNYRRVLFGAVAYYGVFIVALIIYNTQVPYNIFQNFRQMQGVVEYHRTVLNVERTIRWIDYVKLSIFIPWIYSLYRIKNGPWRTFGLIFILNISDWSFFYTLNAHLGETNWLYMIYCYWGFRIILITYILIYFATERKYRRNLPSI